MVQWLKVGYFLPAARKNRYTGLFSEAMGRQVRTQRPRYVREEHPDWSQPDGHGLHRSLEAPYPSGSVAFCERLLGKK